jgi:hypothetical protein
LKSLTDIFLGTTAKWIFLQTHFIPGIFDFFYPTFCGGISDAARIASSEQRSSNNEVGTIFLEDQLQTINHLR